MKNKDGFKPLTHAILAEGEATGHHHLATGDGVMLLESPSGNRRLSAPRGSAVTHQEHHTVDIPAGDFDVVKVREYDHFAEESRAVVD